MDDLIRGYEDGDATGVALCLTSAAGLDDTLLPMSADEWRAYTARPFNNGARDFLVAERGGTVVGVAMSTRLERDDGPLRSFRVIVHPHHRRRGIAKRMLDAIEGQDPASDTTLRAATQGRWRAGRTMLERRGFVIVERVLWMCAADAPRPAALPAGFTLRPYRGDAADDAAWRRLNREGYEGTSEFTDLVAAERKAVRAQARFHLWLAERGGEPVGLCHTRAFSGKSYVESLVVSPSCRGHGLGRALLRAGMRTLRDQAEGAIWLSVRADNDHAVALYESEGFVADDEILEWSKRRPGSAARQE